MQLSDIQLNIQDYGYGTDTAAIQLRRINAVYRKIHGAQRWPFLEKQDKTLNTTAGTSAYTLPMSDWRNLDAVRLQLLAQNIMLNLDYKAPQELRDYENIDVDQSSPFYWSWYNGQLHFYPNPDAAYNVIIDYISEPADLAASSDVPVIPVPYHDLLVLGAVVQMAHRERDWIGENTAQSQYDDLYKKMDDEYLLRQRQTSSHVKRSGYNDTAIPYPFIHDGF